MLGSLLSSREDISVITMFSRSRKNKDLIHSFLQVYLVHQVQRETGENQEPEDMEASQASRETEDLLETVGLKGRRVLQELRVIKVYLELSV